MKNQKIAVLLAAFNGEKYIEEQAVSILNQRYVDTDLIVYDDGSTDKTLSILESLLIEYPNRITIIKNTGSLHGPFHSFSSLINRLNSSKKIGLYNFVAFSDQDDIWLPYKLKNSVDQMKKNDAKMSISSGIASDLITSAKITTYSHSVYTFGEALLKNNAIGMTMVVSSGFLSNIFIPENMVLKNWLHDHLLYLIALYTGERVVFVDYAGVLYRQHNNNLIGDIKLDVINRIKNKIKYVTESKIDRIKVSKFLQSNFEGTAQNKMLIKSYLNYDAGNILARSSIVAKNKIYAEKKSTYLISKVLAILKKL